MKLSPSLATNELSTAILSEDLPDCLSVDTHVKFNDQLKMSLDFVFLARDFWCYNLLQPTEYMVQFQASIRVLELVVFHQGVLVLHLASAKRNMVRFHGVQNTNID